MKAEPLKVWAGPAFEFNSGKRDERLEINPIVRAHMDGRYDVTWRRNRYGSLMDHYELTSIEEAELAVLPRIFEKTEPSFFSVFVSAAERKGLRTLVFGSGDLEPIVPNASVVLMHPGPTRGKQPAAAVLALPYFFSDRALVSETRQDSERASVAFCGQGASRPGSAVIRTAERAFGHARNMVAPTKVVPPIRGHVRLRSKALALLESDPGIDSNFIVRDQYRAGVSSALERSRTQSEFDANLRSATYALSVRGTGNFSARFYEALSFGRIPLFVDTDCVLPFEDQIDWRARTVWVDASKVGSIAERLRSEHARGTDDPDRSVLELRALWEEWLTPDGYFRNIIPVLRSLL